MMSEGQAGTETRRTFRLSRDVDSDRIMAYQVTGDPLDFAQILEVVEVVEASGPEGTCECGMPHLGGQEHADECPVATSNYLASCGFPPDPEGTAREAWPSPSTCENDPHGVVRTPQNYEVKVAPPDLDEGTAREDEDPEATCRRCGGPNVSWSAPSPLWNAVMRGGSINGPWEFNELVCPTCFVVLAEERGVASGWKVDAANVAVPLETVTPSGRTWDADRGLWIEAASGGTRPALTDEEAPRRGARGLDGKLNPGDWQ